MYRHTRVCFPLTHTKRQVRRSNAKNKSSKFALAALSGVIGAQTQRGERCEEGELTNAVVTLTAIPSLPSPLALTSLPPALLSRQSLSFGQGIKSTFTLRLPLYCKVSYVPLRFDSRLYFIVRLLNFTPNLADIHYLPVNFYYYSFAGDPACMPSVPATLLDVCLAIQVLITSCVEYM